MHVSVFIDCLTMSLVDKNYGRSRWIYHFSIKLETRIVWLQAWQQSCRNDDLAIDIKSGRTHKVKVKAMQFISRNIVVSFYVTNLRAASTRNSIVAPHFLDPCGMEGWVKLGLVDATGDWIRIVWLCGQSVNHNTTAPNVWAAMFHSLFSSQITVKCKM